MKSYINCIVTHSKFEPWRLTDVITADAPYLVATGWNISCPLDLHMYMLIKHLKLTI